MKWVLLTVALVSVIPLIGLLRRNTNLIPKVWMIVGFLFLQHGPLHLTMAFISWAGQWRGYTYGFEVSLLDLILLAIYTNLPREQFFVPFKFSMIFYFLTVMLSAFAATVPMATLFYAWQLLRVFFAYAVITKACRDSRVAPALLKGMAAGLLLALGEAIWERFGLGVSRTYGGFSQENFFGVVSHFVVFPFFALLLAGERGWLAPTVSFGGLVISVLTISRATLAASGLGYVVMFMMSAVRRWTPRKTTVAAISVIAILAIMPIFFSSFGERFSNSIASSFLGTDEERVALTKAASMMLSDHPMGVGANQFIVIANTQGYYARAGVSWMSFDAIVHNVYWLIAAETGYLGLIAFVILLLQPMITAFLCGWRNRRDQRGDLLLGLGIALVTVYLHSFYEWVFITFQVQYIFAATIGLIAGIAQQLGYWSHKQVVETTGGTYLEPPKGNAATSYSKGLSRHRIQ